MTDIRVGYVQAQNAVGLEFTDDAGVRNTIVLRHDQAVQLVVPLLETLRLCAPVDAPADFPGLLADLDRPQVEIGTALPSRDVMMQVRTSGNSAFQFNLDDATWASVIEGLQKLLSAPKKDRHRV